MRAQVPKALKQKRREQIILKKEGTVYPFRNRRDLKWERINRPLRGKGGHCSRNKDWS
jgi:hypothetical protein